MRLKDKLNIKSKIVKEHQHGITYCVECSEEKCNENYEEETGRRLSERVVDHNVLILKHLVERSIAPLAFKSLVSSEVIIVRTHFAEK